jgi:hypothetical protein
VRPPGACGIGLTGDSRSVMTTAARTRACASLNRRGEPCKAPPLTGGAFCAAHDADSAFGTHTAAVAAGRLGGRPAVDRIAKQVREDVAAVLHELGVVGVYGEQGYETRPAAFAQRTGQRVREAP